MRTKVLKFKVLALLASVFVLALAIACGSSDETTTAAATPDVAKIIQDAVNAQGTSATGDIEQAVAAALAGQEGLTRADVESIVTNATAGGLSAADVQRIVDQSVSNLPVPEINVGQLSSLVESAVAARRCLRVSMPPRLVEWCRLRWAPPKPVLSLAVTSRPSSRSPFRMRQRANSPLLTSRK